jgi:hypothetical protein
MTMEQAIHLNAVADPQAAKAKLVIDALAGDRDLTPAELGLLDEVARVPGVKAARDARFTRQHAARVAVAQAAEAEREAARTERIETRRAKWREASAFTRACHVLAERVRADSPNGKLLLMLAELVADPNSTLLTRKRYALGKALPREERAPPLTFEPNGNEFDDPIGDV